MVTEHLTLRNNTSTPIVLKRIERFQAEEKSFGASTFNTLASNLTNVLTNQTRSASVAVINHDSRPFEENHVDIHLEPFETKKTELRSFIDSQKERMRLIFEVEGQKYQIQTPVPTEESATMKALSENPKFQFTGVYVTPESFLAIYSSANLNAGCTSSATIPSSQPSQSQARTTPQPATSHHPQYAAKPSARASSSRTACASSISACSLSTQKTQPATSSSSYTAYSPSR